eukprot:2554026-Pleurochrysis_carterae.AAC.2
MGSGENAQSGNGCMHSCVAGNSASGKAKWIKVGICVLQMRATRAIVSNSVAPQVFLAAGQCRAATPLTPAAAPRAC